MYHIYNKNGTLALAKDRKIIYCTYKEWLGKQAYIPEWHKITKKQYNNYLLRLL